MFDSYEFTFDGESSLMHGLMLYDFDGKGQSNVSFGNKASIIETRTNTRIQPLHFGVNHNESPLQFKLVFGSTEPLDRYELEEISYWLTGHQEYRWLSIDQPDLEHVQFYCIVSELTPLHHGWLPVAFEATIICDCPYAYGFPFEQAFTVEGEKKALFRNESSVREYISPTLTYTTSNGGPFVIVNHDDGNREFRIDDIPTGEVEITIDGTNGIITETTHGYNLYKGFNLNFLRFVSGDNHLTITGNGELTITGRLLHNVAG